MAHKWTFASSDRRYGVDLEASDNGALSGTLIFDGTRYTVVGGWDAQFSAPGRNFSAFAVSGFMEQSTEAPNFIGAAGYIFGSGDVSLGMHMLMDVSSSALGSVLQYRGIFNPA